jgi:hypothetical protein
MTMFHYSKGTHTKKEINSTVHIQINAKKKKFTKRERNIHLSLPDEISLPALQVAFILLETVFIRHTICETDATHITTHWLLGFAVMEQGEPVIVAFDRILKTKQKIYNKTHSENKTDFFFFFCVLPVPRRKCVCDRFRFPTV